MKRNVWLVGCVALFATVGVNAQTKISFTATCKSDTQQNLEVGDRPGHILALWKVDCTYVQPTEIGGEKVKDGYSVGLSEDTTTRSTDSGHHVATTDNGDKTFTAFHGTTPLKDGKRAGDTNGTWSYTGGTGKLKGIKGKGKFRVTRNDDGTVTVAGEGEYELPASKTK